MLVSETAAAPPVRFDAGDAERLVASADAGPVLLEQFRNLAALLDRTQRERVLRSVVITSPAPGDGKSHVAANLALTLSESYRRRVLLVDADLRKPTLHDVFRISSRTGLSDTLKADREELPEGVRVTDRLTVVPGGRPDPNPIGDLASGRLARLLAKAVTQYDWVLIDTPPAAGLADARIVSEAADATLVVVRAGVTRFPDLDDAAHAIGPERILGVVLNAVDPSEIRRDDYYGAYYGYGRK